MSRSAAVVAILGVLAGGWTAAVLLMGYVIGKGFLGLEQPRRTYIGLLFLAGQVLLPAAPAVAALIAARQGWSAGAWIFGILAAAVALVLIVWSVLNFEH
ncbi:hypothetical protein [Actinoplanes sp. NPDC026619]|uniref:hypothetical protein n=1 Tax=Actinoplanes sp. NPDC026619 TaxID=3155798 RepID=UPI0033E9A1B9